MGRLDIDTQYMTMYDNVENKLIYSSLSLAYLSYSFIAFFKDMMSSLNIPVIDSIAK